jgi:hypothetical protein
MIDLSIRTVRKACSISCTRDALMKRRVVIREKFDGTKLTLYRNDVPWDKDYTKNWIVSYKDLRANNETHQLVEPNILEVV